MNKIKVNSNRMQDVTDALANLSGVHSIQEIVDLIKKIPGIYEDTLNDLQSKPYDGYFKPEYHVQLEDINIDIDYQRKLRLQKVIKKLLVAGGFIKEAAGHIDIAIRPNGKKFCWDGFRRSIMAGLCGLEYMPVSTLKHKKSLTETECQEIEARMFKTRNADSENMKPEEIFKAKVAYKDPESLKFLKFLKNANLDVEGLNTNGGKLGGFKFIWDIFRKNEIEEEYLIKSSSILQKIWANDPNYSAYLIGGLAYFLKLNDEFDYTVTEKYVIECIEKYVNAIKPKLKQKELIGSRIQGQGGNKILPSLTFYLVKNVINLNGNTGKFIKQLKLTKEDIEVLEEFDE
jgi:hypothetical protein